MKLRNIVFLLLSVFLWGCAQDKPNVKSQETWERPNWLKVMKSEVEFQMQSEMDLLEGSAFTESIRTCFRLGRIYSLASDIERFAETSKDVKLIDQASSLSQEAEQSMCYCQHVETSCGTKSQIDDDSFLESQVTRLQERHAEMISGIQEYESVIPRREKGEDDDLVSAMSTLTSDVVLTEVRALRSETPPELETCVKAGKIQGQITNLVNQALESKQKHLISLASDLEEKSEPLGCYCDVSSDICEPDVDRGNFDRFQMELERVELQTEWFQDRIAK